MTELPGWDRPVERILAMRGDRFAQPHGPRAYDDLPIPEQWALDLLEAAAEHYPDQDVAAGLLSREDRIWVGVPEFAAMAISCQILCDLPLATIRAEMLRMMDAQIAAGRSD